MNTLSGLFPTLTEQLRVLIVSRSAADIKTLQAAIADAPEFECSARLLSNGPTDPLQGLSQSPDVLLLRCDPDHLGELGALGHSTAVGRPALIVVGPAHPEAMKLALRCGAKDYLIEPLGPEELVAALRRIAAARRAESAAAAGVIDVVMGAAGGVGTSFIACNLAHLTSASMRRSCLLLDLDLTHSPLTHFLDLNPERGLAEAMDALESLDELALAGYVCKHRSGLHLMSALPKGVVLARDLQAERFAKLMHVLSLQYRQVIVDSPHIVDALNATVLGMARSVLLVLQQSVLHVKNAARLMRILTHELSIPRERIRVVLNRLNKRSTVQVEDIQRSLDCSKVFVVPNHYKLSLDSIDTAMPLFDLDKDAAVVRSLMELGSELAGLSRGNARSGLLGRLPLFARKSP